MPSPADKYHAHWMAKSTRAKAHSSRIVARTRAKLCGTLGRQAMMRMNMSSWPHGPRAWRMLVMGKRANISCRPHSMTVITHACIRGQSRQMGDRWLVVARYPLYNAGIRTRMTGMDLETSQKHDYAWLYPHRY